MRMNWSRMDQQDADIKRLEKMNKLLEEQVQNIIDAHHEELESKNEVMAALEKLIAEDAQTNIKANNAYLAVCKEKDAKIESLQNSIISACERVMQETEHKVVNASEMAELILSLDASLGIRLETWQAAIDDLEKQLAEQKGKGAQVISSLKECKRNTKEMSKEYAEDRLTAYLNCVFREDIS